MPAPPICRGRAAAGRQHGPVCEGSTQRPKGHSAHQQQRAQRAVLQGGQPPERGSPLVGWGAVGAATALSSPRQRATLAWPLTAGLHSTVPTHHLAAVAGAIHGGGRRRGAALHRRGRQPAHCAAAVAAGRVRGAAAGPAPLGPAAAAAAGELRELRQEQAGREPGWKAQSTAQLALQGARSTIKLPAAASALATMRPRACGTPGLPRAGAGPATQESWQMHQGNSAEKGPTSLP